MAGFGVQFLRGGDSDAEYRPAGGCGDGVQECFYDLPAVYTGAGNAADGAVAARDGHHRQLRGGVFAAVSPPLTERTWIDEAARLGYHVGYFGKWHLGPVNPEARGAHRFDPDAEVQRRPYDPETSSFSYQFAKDNYDRQTQGLIRGRAPFWGDTAQPKEACPPFPVMENGVRFLEEWAEGDRSKPFFLTVSSAEPHFPHHLPEPYAGIAQELRARSSYRPI